MSEQQPIVVELDLRDVAMAVQIIDLSAERGAFKGPELQVVGEYRGRLAQIVQENQPAVEDTPAEEGAAE